MNYYRLGANDQSRPSWVLFETAEPLPKRPKRPELPSTVHRLLGRRPEGKMRIKPQYEPLRCKTCGRYDASAMFEIGFDEPVQIRIKGDFGDTDVGGVNL